MNSANNIFALTVTAPRIEFDLLWTLIFLFAGLSIAYFVLVFLLKRRLTKKEKEAIVLKKDIAPMLSTLLFKADDGTREEGEDVVNAKVHVKELLKNPARRTKISEILIDIRADLPEETRKRVLKMYLDFGLHEDAIQKLKSWRWEEVCKGIDELTQMQVTDAYIYIRRFINDNRSIVRKQAQLAMVALKPEGIVYFLDHAKHAISEWQQLKILEILQSLPDYTPPRFRLWLTSNNQHVVLFAMRLIRSFDQNDAMESISKLVKHKDDTIKVEAIVCIRDFNYKAALPLFKRIFHNCKSEVKIALLNAIGEMGDPQDIPFLRHAEQQADDHIVKSKIIGTINALVPETILPSDQINESLAADLAVLEVGNIEDLTMKTDSDSPDELHTDFQDVLHSPDFKAGYDGSEDEDLCFDVPLEEDLKNLPVHAEFLDITGPQQEEQKTEPETTIHDRSEAEPMAIIQKTNEPASTGSAFGFFENNYPKSEEGLQDEIQKADPVEATDLSATTYEDLFPTGWKVSTDEDPERTEQAADDLNAHDSNSTVPQFQLELRPYEANEDNPDYLFLLEDLKEPEIEDVGRSEFERIFHHVNEDMRLEILSDILNLGDARELPFLCKLRKDKSANIRRNAERTLEILANRLRPEMQVAEAAIGHSDISPAVEELSFEIDRNWFGLQELLDEVAVDRNQEPTSQTRSPDCSEEPAKKKSDE